MQEGESPSGRYVLAWTLPQHPKVDWKRVTRDQLEERYGDEIEQGKASNLIVETRTRRVVGTIPHRTIKPNITGGNVVPGWNHLTVSGIWSPNEQQAIFVYAGDWSFEAIYYARRDGNTFHIVEIGNTIEKYLRNYLRRTHRAAYDKAHWADQHNPSIMVGEDPHLQGDVLTLDLSAFTPKDYEDQYFDYEDMMRVQLTHRTGKLSCRILSLKPVR